MNILGISAFYHDSAACLIQEGKIIACAQEERFSRIKHDFSFPIQAINYCLKEGKISVNDLDFISFYEKPFLKLERILTSYLVNFPRSYPAFLKALPFWLKEKIWIPHRIKRELNYAKEVLMIEHHLSHAASSFLISPFEQAAILTVDGVGEWAVAAYGIGNDNQIEIIKEQKFPHSLGLLYNAFTYYLGFQVNSDEYKVMGLAPYGQPVYYELILKKLVNLKEDGSFQVNLNYFPYDYGLAMINRKFEALFRLPSRNSKEPLTQKHKDIAASIQKVTEEIMLKMAQHLHKETNLPNLCLAGGVTLNCVANGRILRESGFENLFIQPAAGDAGGAVGVAAYIHYSLLNHPRNFVWEHAYWGPEFTDDEIRSLLESKGLPFRRIQTSELPALAAKLLAQGKVLGWFQGRMEFGPRALGNRSILADPRDPNMKDLVNRKIKFREEFRPFAPAILEERVSDYFEINCPSPYMLLVAQVREDKKNQIPAVTHVDGSARIQTVSRKQNPLFYALLKEFEKLTGCPVLLNTSFNLKGEPIVCTPQDAYSTFIRSGLDYLIMGDCILDKKQMPETDKFQEKKVLPEETKTITIR
jgi:carbamoyltransferase